MNRLDKGDKIKITKRKEAAKIWGLRNEKHGIAITELGWADGEVWGQRSRIWFQIC